MSASNDWLNGAPKKELSTRLGIANDCIYVHDCGKHNRSISIHKSNPRRIQIGCTSYSKKEALHKINRIYDNNPIKQDYLDAVQLAFNSVPLSWKLSMHGLPKIKFGKDLVKVFHLFMIINISIAVFSITIHAASRNHTVTDLLDTQSFMTIVYIVIPYILYHVGKFLKNNISIE